MSKPLDHSPEPANLRFLRRLVTVLTVVMIGGLLVIVSLIVIRFSSAPATVPDSITLPNGVTAEAFTMAEGWFAVVVEGGTRILIFDRDTGALRQSVEIEAKPGNSP